MTKRATPGTIILPVDHPERWHVRRAGSPDPHHYGRGWHAFKGHGRTQTGAWLPSWRDAMSFATVMAADDRARMDAVYADRAGRRYGRG